MAPSPPQPQPMPIPMPNWALAGRASIPRNINPARPASNRGRHRRINNISTPFEKMARAVPEATPPAPSESIRRNQACLPL